MTRVPPRATYRLQLHAGFTFADAAAAIPYFAELGVSHLYLSPVLQAAAGSMHGYDVVDPERVSADLGGEEGLRALAAAAREAGLGLLLDIVPNHMSITGTDNRWWRDVLENGPASFYASAFDVDWPATGNDRVVLPVLGERYGRALTSGVLGVERAGGRVAIRAHDMRYPCSPRILGPVVRDAGRRIRHAELEYVGEALAALPSSHERDREARRRRHRHRAVLLGRLEELCTDPRIDAALDAELAAINADPAALDALLEGQNYRLVFWKNAADHLPYRRFFDVTTLVGVRCEDPDVLEASHARIFAWLADGTIDGVRVDHVDGLVRPGEYLTALRGRAPGAWILVEKILGMDETLPPAWPIDGTTGYEHADAVGRLLVDPDGVDALAATFEAYTGERFDPATTRRSARLEVMSDALHSELERVTDLALRACRASPACRDYTRAEIQTTIAELLAGYPVYRTYLGEGEPAPRDLARDRARIAAAAGRATAANPGLDGDLVAFLEAALAFELPLSEAQELARVVQQVTGPIVAKGDEDTLSYRQISLAARCEVGADIGALSDDPAAIHAFLAHAGPRTMLASSTHDTKRAEDVRARMAVLSELPAVWQDVVGSWGERAAPGWGDVPRDRIFEYLMWQTLVGAWPIEEARSRAYAEKACREARLRTSWRAPDETYEKARDRWLAQVYADRVLVAEIEALAARLQPHGDRNSLAMLAIKLTAPGVPDLYQGAELRADSLVDPDNRRPVDLALRQRELRAQRDLAPADVASDLSRAKLWTIRRVLGLRRRSPSLFEGAYRPLRASGPHAHRVFAFARGENLVTIVPRLSAGADAWRDTQVELPPGAWRDVLTDRAVAGGAVPAALVWSGLPIAVLVSDAARERGRSA